MNLTKQIILAALGFSSGTIISAGIYSFITVIGVLPRLAQKSHTERHVKIYEEVILLGGIFGTIASFFKFSIILPSAVVMLLSMCGGIFIGCLAVSLAEVVNVIPIFTRRAHIQRGLMLFVIMLALGKMGGSLFYFMQSGFFKPN